MKSEIIIPILLSLSLLEIHAFFSWFVKDIYHLLVWLHQGMKRGEEEQNIRNFIHTLVDTWLFPRFQPMIWVNRFELGPILLLSGLAMSILQDDFSMFSQHIWFFLFLRKCAVFRIYKINLPWMLQFPQQLFWANPNFITTPFLKTTRFQLSD